jgi:uncharacterized protein with ParB-like and HNH nuclease domain
MEGKAKKLIRFMEGTDQRFLIPVYQRNYDWRKEPCSQLYNDLIKVVRKGSKNHFFGSIVSVGKPDGNGHEFYIIDGQQRLTKVF